MGFTILFYSAFEICPLGEKKEARDKSFPFTAKKDQISNNFELEAEIDQHKLANGVICPK